jgi:hypothetical protein
VLVSSVALGAAAAISLSDIGALAASAAAALPLKVRVTLDGKRYEFDEAKGRDLGDYKGPGFVQRCVRVTVPDLPLSVFLRPDRDSERVEVVFELGRLWSGPPRHFGAYTVEIQRGDKELARIEVPKHFWFSRWRWQSARRPIIAKVSELIAAGLVPPYGDVRLDKERPQGEAKPPPARPQARGPDARPAEAGPGAALPPGSSVVGGLHRDANGQLEVVARPPVPAPQQQAPHQAPRPAARPAALPAGAAHPYVIMGLAGLTAYMPTTGERDDIGPLTEAQARWLCTGDGAALDAMFAQAEASGTVPWHVRDEKTGAPFNFEQYPKGGWYGEKNINEPDIPLIKSEVTPDAAHHPALTYLPFLLTGDPYLLDALQLQLTWCLGSNPPAYRLGAKGILPHGQTRSYAWCLRDLAQLAKVTPEAAPGWMLPRAYWQRILENNRLWFEESYVRDPEPLHRIFHSATAVSVDNREAALNGAARFAAWEEEFLAFILGWTVAMGFPSWRDAFMWKVASTIARTDGKSGWQRAWSTPYGMAVRRSNALPWAQSWAEAWALNVELQKWHVWAPPRPGTVSPGPTGRSKRPASWSIGGACALDAGHHLLSVGEDGLGLDAASGAQQTHEWIFDGAREQDAADYARRNNRRIG